VEKHGEDTFNLDKNIRVEKLISKKDCISVKN